MGKRLELVDDSAAAGQEPHEPVACGHHEPAAVECCSMNDVVDLLDDVLTHGA
jgi:hypothetical protein